MEKTRVLFICEHNSARSQMAEAFLNELGGDRFDVESAGLEPGKLNPFVVQVMKEAGIDISNKTTKSVSDIYTKERFYHYVITVCDVDNSERCPAFLSVGEKLNWSFEDPSKFEGSYEEKLEKTRKTRDLIRRRIENFLILPASEE